MFSCMLYHFRVFADFTIACQNHSHQTRNRWMLDRTAPHYGSNSGSSQERALYAAIVPVPPLLAIADYIKPWNLYRAQLLPSNINQQLTSPVLVSRNKRDQNQQHLIFVARDAVSDQMRLYKLDPVGWRLTVVDSPIAMHAVCADTLHTQSFYVISRSWIYRFSEESGACATIVQHDLMHPELAVLLSSSDGKTLWCNGANSRLSRVDLSVRSVTAVYDPICFLRMVWRRGPNVKPDSELLVRVLVGSGHTLRLCFAVSEICSNRLTTLIDDANAVPVSFACTQSGVVILMHSDRTISLFDPITRSRTPLPFSFASEDDVWCISLIDEWNWLVALSKTGMCYTEIAPELTLRAEAGDAPSLRSDTNTTQTNSIISLIKTLQTLPAATLALLSLDCWFRQHFTFTSS